MQQCLWAAIPHMGQLRKLPLSALLLSLWASLQGFSKEEEKGLSDNAPSLPEALFLGGEKAGPQKIKTGPGSPLFRGIRRNLCGSAGGFCRSVCLAKRPAEERSHRTPKVLQNFESQA